MPGSAFKTKPFRGGIKQAAPKRPATPNQGKTFVPRATSSNGMTARAVQAPRAMKVRVTSKARKNVPMPSVRQGAQVGTPGHTGSPPGAKPW